MQSHLQNRILTCFKLAESCRRKIIIAKLFIRMYTKRYLPLYSIETSLYIILLKLKLMKILYAAIVCEKQNNYKFQTYFPIIHNKKKCYDFVRRRAFLKMLIF